MKDLYIVKYSIGEYEDCIETIDSVWTTIELANKRVKILEELDSRKLAQQSICFDCPINCVEHTLDNLDEVVDKCKKNCKLNCKFTVCRDSKYPYVECKNNCIHYEHRTIFSPEACCLDNMELLDETKIRINSD